MDLKWRPIAARLEAGIADGTHRAGDRLPSEQQLSRTFGVSRPTAARAIRELEARGLVDRRRGSGTYVAGGAGAVRIRTFGLLAHGLSATEMIDPITTELTRVCQARGERVLWGDSPAPHDTVDEVDRLIAHYIEQRVDGVFFAPMEAAADRARHNVRVAEALHSRGIQVVLLDRDVVEFPDRSEFPLVGIDNVLAGAQLTRHLVRAGHRRVCFLARPHHPSTTELRAIGCLSALNQAGVAPLPEWRWSADPEDRPAIEQLVARDRPDAVVCSNDLTAVALIRTLEVLGRQVPAEVAVVGFDDAGNSLLAPIGLTTMRQPFRELAVAAVDCMDAALSGNPTPHQILATGQLVVRESCGASRARPPGGRQPKSTTRR